MRFWIGDRLVDAAVARVSVLDRGFLVGDAVFDTTTVVPDGAGGLVPFALDRHLRRLLAGATQIGLELAGDRVRDAMIAVCEGNPDLAPGAALRVTLTTGEGPIAHPPDAAHALVVVVARPPEQAPPASITAAISPWPVAAAGALAGVKSTSYGAGVRALRWAISVGAREAILCSTTGHVVEGSTTNVFAVLGGRVVTPDLSSGCLPGVTRALLIQWCGEAGLPVVQAPLPLARLWGAEELFVTNAVRGVQRVGVLLDSQGESVWTSASNPVGERVERLYGERAAADPNP